MCVLFFHDAATSVLYTLSLHDALPIYGVVAVAHGGELRVGERRADALHARDVAHEPPRQIDVVDAHVDQDAAAADRKSTRLNSSHTVISYAVFCLKKKKIIPKKIHSRY